MTATTSSQEDLSQLVLSSRKWLVHARCSIKFPDPLNIALWNAMFKGYAQNESYREVLVLFSNMKSLDVMPNRFTFPIVLKSCGKINAYVEGQEVQCVAIKVGFRANPFVGTTLIEMYAGGGVVREAYKVFGEMVERNLVSWISMISVYILCRNSRYGFCTASF